MELNFPQPYNLRSLRFQPNMVSRSGKKLCFDHTGQTYPWRIERWIAEIYPARTCIIELSIWKNHTLTPRKVTIRLCGSCFTLKKNSVLLVHAVAHGTRLLNLLAQLTCYWMMKRVNNFSCFWILSNKRLRFISISKKTNFKFSLTAQ